MGDIMTVEIHMVGGAVRDMLMGIEPKDIDYVVVGASPDYMINKMGMTQVGQDFPVFLDDKGQEYALARKEYSTGDGYTDFKFEWENLNPELLGKFISKGYDPDKEYDIEELISVFQHINQ